MIIFGREKRNKRIFSKGFVLPGGQKRVQCSHKAVAHTQENVANVICFQQESIWAPIEHPTTQIHPDFELNFHSTHLFGWVSISTLVRSTTASQTDRSNPTGLRPVCLQALPFGQPFCSCQANPTFQSMLASCPSKLPLRLTQAASSPLNLLTFWNHSVAALTPTSSPKAHFNSTLRTHPSNPPFEPTPWTPSNPLLETQKIPFDRSLRNSFRQPSFLDKDAPV